MSESRAGFNVYHLRGGGGKRTSGTTVDRRNLLRECARHLDSDDLAYQASRNANIIEADAHWNLALVNDGKGGFKEATSVDEILDYGDKRVSKVHRKLQEGARENSTIVAFLPKSLCRESPDYYPREKGGARSRWVAADHREAEKYFKELLDYLGSNVLYGGSDAIHSLVINFDESTPHAHILVDNFAPDPKKPGELRLCARETWYNSRNVTEQRVDPKTGKLSTVEISGATKLRRYQDGLKNHMINLGYEIEAEVDPHTTSAGKAEYVELQELKAELAEAEARLPKLKAKAEVEAKTITSEASQQASQLVERARNQAASIQQQAERRARETRLKADREASEARNDGYRVGYSKGASQGRSEAYNAAFGKVEEKYTQFVREALPSTKQEIDESIKSALEAETLDTPTWQERALKEAGIYDSSYRNAFAEKRRHLMRMGRDFSDDAVNKALNRTKREFLGDPTNKVDTSPSMLKNGSQRSQEAQPDM